MASDPYRYFRLEARELLEQLENGILEMEKGGGDAALVQRLLRHAHTLKGAARVVKQQHIADHAHAIEDVLSPYRDAADAVPAQFIETILKVLGEIGEAIRLLDVPAEPPPASIPTAPSAPPQEAHPGAAGLPAPSETLKTVRVDIADMDALLDGIAEIHALLNGLRTVAGTLEPARHVADLLLTQLAPIQPTAKGAAGTGRGTDQTRSMAEELWKSLGKFDRSLGSVLDQTDRELRQLRDAAEQLRLVSVESLLMSLERTARDSARALGKSVTFAGSGGDMRLDAHVLGTVQAALVQIIRNALAHGIETADERRAAGKPEIGAVRVDVQRRGRSIVFTCSDDGRGVDLDAVRRIAVRRGLVPEDAADSNGEDLIRMLLRGGISTSDAVTEISGRGIGLDVVRAAVEQLGGTVTVNTVKNQGTTFQVSVPPSLASMEALTVEAAGTVASIPLDAILGTLRLAEDEVAHSSSGASMVFQGSGIPFIPLQRALDGTRPGASRNWTTVVVAGPSGTAAFGVDRLLGTARVVMRPLPTFTPTTSVVAGASLDAEGNPQLVLDPDGLVAEALNTETHEPETGTPTLPVLVIDDSLTTRMLEQSILQSAGYDVDVAVSAEDGLECAKRKRYGLFLVDVEMPGMDGFTFIEQIRSDPALYAIPAILVTSRASPEDRQRGADAGAQGYVVKSEFDQAKLLKMIKPLMG